MKAEDENKPASEVAAEGEQVTGGSGEAQESETTENTQTNTSEKEVTTDSETKKEEMNSYNELPDQAKVGGG